MNIQNKLPRNSKNTQTTKMTVIKNLVTNDYNVQEFSDIPSAVFFLLNSLS